MKVYDTNKFVLQFLLTKIGTHSGKLLHYKQHFQILFQEILKFDRQEDVFMMGLKLNCLNVI